MIVTIGARIIEAATRMPTAMKIFSPRERLFFELANVCLRKGLGCGARTGRAAIDYRQLAVARQAGG